MKRDRFKTMQRVKKLSLGDSNVTTYPTLRRDYVG